MRTVAAICAFVIVGCACGGAPTSAPSATATSSASTVAASPTPSARPVPAEIASAGKLRVAFRVQGVFIQKSSTGTLSGVQVDLASELARRMGVPAVVAEYPTIDAVLKAARDGLWDITFDTVDATKTEVEFTPPFGNIDQTYAVPVNSSIRSVKDVDRIGIRVVVNRGTSNDRFLTENLKPATIVRGDTPAQVDQIMVSSGADARSGSRQELLPFVASHPEFRVLDDFFVTNRWAIAVPKGHPEVLAYLTAVLADLKTSGFVKASIDKMGLIGVTIPPQ